MITDDSAMPDIQRLSRPALRPGPRRLAERRDRAAVRRDRSGVAGPALQAAPGERHSADLNRDEPGDDDDEQSLHPGRQVSEELAERRGAVTEEPQPAVYVYHQVFDGRRPDASPGAASWPAAGWSGLAKGKSIRTKKRCPGPKHDRLLLTRACKANLSQIFGLFPDAENAAQDLLEQAVAGVTPLEATDHLGVVHRMWPVTDLSR